MIKLFAKLRVIKRPARKLMRHWRNRLKSKDGFFTATPMATLLTMIMKVLDLMMRTRIILNVVIAPSQVTIASKIAAVKYFAAAIGGEETLLDAVYANVFANCVSWSFSKPFITFSWLFSKLFIICFQVFSD